MGQVRQVFKLFRVRETGNAEFWASHAIILLSTVLGVYLAAQAGYRTAVEFEVSRTDREGYYLRRALLDEVRHNLQWADRLVDAVAQDPYNFLSGNEKPQTFVWETMRQQSTTFQLPPETLAAIRDYYDGIEGHVRAMMPSPVSTKGQEAQTWKAETKRMRETVLPSLEKDMAELRSALTSRGIRSR